jgi:hypothetical protein
MTKKTKKVVLVGTVLGLGVVGYLVYRRTHPLPLPPGSVAQNLMLVSGSTPTVTLSVASKGTLSLQAPTGSTLGNVTLMADGILAPAAGGIPYEYVAARAGSTTVTATYTDATGKTQTSTIPVTVTA